MSVEERESDSIELVKQKKIALQNIQCAVSDKKSGKFNTDRTEMPCPCPQANRTRGGALRIDWKFVR